jgi:hypothetical protein
MERKMITLKVSNRDEKCGKAVVELVRAVGTMTPKTRGLFIRFITGKQVEVTQSTASFFDDVLEAIEMAMDTPNALDFIIEAEADVMDAVEP